MRVGRNVQAVSYQLRLPDAVQAAALRLLDASRQVINVPPRRWVVERTFAWIGRQRRMSKDYEYLLSSSESMVCLTMIRLMVKRLARATEASGEQAWQAQAA